MQDLVAESMGFEAIITTNRDLRFAMQAFADVDTADLEDFGSKDDWYEPMPRNILAEPATNKADLLFPCAWTRTGGSPIVFEKVDKKIPPEYATVKLENNIIAGDAYSAKFTGELYVKWDLSACDALHHEMPLPTNTGLFFSFGQNLGLTSSEAAHADRKINLMFSYLLGSLTVGKRGFIAPIINIVYKPMLMNTMYSKLPFSAMEQPEVKLGERKIDDVVSVAAQPTPAGAPVVHVAPEPQVPVTK